MVSLDGGNRVVGTEFIKLLNTGSSDLATVEYVDEQVALGGGGGNVDLSNYYTQTEVDTLLNNKLNVNNPQDVLGTLRIDSTNGNGKLIVNAVGAPNDEDFYVNGLSNLGGTLKAQVIQASSNIQTSQQIQSNVINTYSNSNLIIQRNAIPYITLDSQIVDDETVEKIILMKDVEFSGGLSLNTLSVDTLNTIGLNDMVFNVATLGEFLRFQVSDNTVRVPNTRSFLSQDIYLDNLRPLTFSTDVVLYGGNSTNDAYEEYVRLDASAEKVSISKETKFENAMQLNQGQSIKWTNVFIREVQGATRPEFDLIVNGSTSHLRLWVNGAIKQAITNTTIACKVNIDVEQGITVFTGQQLKTNTINSHTNSNLVIQRSGSTYMTFQSDRININQALHLSATLFIDTVNKLSLKPSLEGGVNIFDIRNLHPVADNPMIRFRVGEGGGETIICEMTNNGVSIARNLVVGTAYELRTNALDTNGDNDLVISRNNIPFLTLDKFTEDTIEKEAIICSKEIVASSGIKNNIFDSDGNNNVIFQRDGMEYFRLTTASEADVVSLATGKGLSATLMYCNTYSTRVLTNDTIFLGANTDGNGRTEYMRWNRADQSLDFNAPIDNTNIAVIGNIVDTTVSDERLKTNIEDVESNYCDCVKNVKIKTFEYKDEKYKDSDKYGFIAQHLQKHLPKEFNNIVKETKPKKDEGEAYLSINYMKLSVVLWGALQETLNKVEHLEASVYELQEELKDSKKPTPKSKAKAKSKSKAKNVD